MERRPRRNRAPEKILIVVVEPDDEARNRCPRRGNRGVPVESDVRRWHSLDVHGKRCFLESAVPRIECAEHGKITASVPRARHDDRFSAPFEDHAAWPGAQMPWTKACAGLRITWEALANIAARVTADAAARLDRLEGLRMTGTDEKSRGKGSGKFLTVVTGHERGKIAWIAEGRSQAHTHWAAAPERTPGARPHNPARQAPTPATTSTTTSPSPPTPPSASPGG